MRHALDAAEPARYALLGILLDGPAHGYDLARRFAPNTVLGDVVRLGASHLYALLARLERDELIAGERQESGARPPRRVYRLTAAGREAVLRWVDAPVERPRDMLIDFPLKLYVARRISPARAAALVERQHALFSAYLAHLETEPAADASDDAAFLALIREGRIERTQAALTWLERCETVLGRADDVTTKEGVPGMGM